MALPVVGVIDMENRDGAVYKPGDPGLIEADVLSGVATVVYTGARCVPMQSAAQIHAYALLRHTHHTAAFCGLRAAGCCRCIEEVDDSVLQTFNAVVCRSICILHNSVHARIHPNVYACMNRVSMVLMYACVLARIYQSMDLQMLRRCQFGTVQLAKLPNIKAVIRMGAGSPFSVALEVWKGEQAMLRWCRLRERGYGGVCSGWRDRVQLSRCMGRGGGGYMACS